MRLRLRRLGALAALLLLTANCSSTDDSVDRTEMRVMAAASLTEVFDELSNRFMDTPAGASTRIELTLAGSATLANQLSEGAPASVVATANTITMDRVRRNRGTSEPQIFATNSLVLVTPSDNPGGVTGPADLARRELLLSLCNEQVPCGWLSIEVINALGLGVVPDAFEANVRAVLTKVELGEVDLGLVYATDARNRDVLTFPLDLRSDLVNVLVNHYPIATLDDSAEAAAFVAFVLSPTGQDILRSYGFGTP